MFRFQSFADHSIKVYLRIRGEPPNADKNLVGAGTWQGKVAVLEIFGSPGGGMYKAKYLDDALVWSDGDIWRRAGGHRMSVCAVLAAFLTSNSGH